jgi:hypothetical protein
MHTVRHDPTRLQPCRRVRGRKNNTRLPTLNPEAPSFWIEERAVSWESALLLFHKADCYPKTLLTIGLNIWYSICVFVLYLQAFNYQPYSFPCLADS